MYGHSSEIDYELDNVAVRPGGLDISDRAVDVDAIPAMLFRGLGARIGKLPVRGLSVLPPRRVELVNWNSGEPHFLDDEISGSPDNVDKAVYYADRAFHMLRQAIRNRVADDGSSHLGVCLSGGLDSCALLIAACEMRSNGEISDLTAFHYVWPDVIECASERAVALGICDALAVSCIPVYEPELALEGMIEYYSSLPFPYPQTFHRQLVVAGDMARGVGVDTLITGVGSELHFAGPGPASYVRDGHQNDDGPRSTVWELSPRYLEENTPDWTTRRAQSVRDENWYRRSSSPDRATAVEEARIFAYLRTYSSLAHEYFLFTCQADVPELRYPYMDPDFVKFASSTPEAFSYFRCGGEVYNKGLLRLALRDKAPTAVSLRSSGAPYEAVEQDYMRKSWSYLRAFWCKDSQLEQLGLIDGGLIRKRFARRREILIDSTFLLPVTLVEGWCRANTNRIT